MYPDSCRARVLTWQSQVPLPGRSGPASPHLLMLESLEFEVAQVTSQAGQCETDSAVQM